MLGSLAKGSLVRDLPNEGDDARLELEGDRLEPLAGSREVGGAKVARAACRPSRSIRQPDAEVDQRPLFVRLELPWREPGGMQQPPEVVARIREGGARGRARQTWIDAAEDESDAGREDVRNDRVGQAASGSRASRRSSRSIRSFSPTSLDSGGGAPSRGSTLTVSSV